MENTPRKRGNETLLAFVLLAILAGAFFFFLNFATLGVFSYMIVAIVGVAALGFFHYVVWGYALSKQVAGEREQQRLKDLLETERDFDDPMPWKHARDEHITHKPDAENAGSP
jgi:Flp pilus assembly protein TadB